MAFSGSLCKDVEGHVHDIFDGSFWCKSIGNIFISSGKRATRKRGLFFLVERNLIKLSKKSRRDFGSCKQRRYADGEEYRTNNLSQ